MVVVVVWFCLVFVVVVGCARFAYFLLECVLVSFVSVNALYSPGGDGVWLVCWAD